jgi:hypothetical protein
VTRVVEVLAELKFFQLRDQLRDHCVWSNFFGELKISNKIFQIVKCQCIERAKQINCWAQL